MGFARAPNLEHGEFKINFSTFQLPFVEEFCKDVKHVMILD
jgi:hypothetical protein